MRSVTGLSYDDIFGAPEPAEWCDHGQRRESCGLCHDDDIQRASFERELEMTEAEDALRLAFRNVLDKINAGGTK